MHYLLWFKKDLRLTDHAALVWAAEQARACGGGVHALWVDEPAAWQQPDASRRHWGFANECVRELAADIAARGGQLLRCRGDMLAVLQG